MSWSELERLVATAEADHHLQKALRRCRSQPELILAAQLSGRAGRQAPAIPAEHRSDSIAISVGRRDG